MSSSSNSAAAAGSDALPRPVGVGVLGLGRIGWSFHCREVMKHAGFRLAAVCDLEESRREEARAASGCATYKRFDAMLKNEAVELVVVAAQSKDHPRNTIKAVRAGKHVFCEKPAAPSVAAFDRMTAAAREAGRVFTVDHSYRRGNDYLFMREVIDSGLLGRIFRIRCRQNSFSRRNDWQTLRKYGGGQLGNWGVHMVDRCLLLAGSPVCEMLAGMDHLVNAGDAEDDIKALMRCEDGTLIDLEVSGADASPNHGWVLLGTCGTLWIDGAEAHLKYFDPQALPPLQVVDSHMVPTRQYGAIGGDTIPWKEETREVKPTGTYDSFYDNLYRAIREGAPLIVTPESARATYEVLSRIRRSSRK